MKVNTELLQRVEELRALVLITDKLKRFQFFLI